jgi:hypothetical protein
MSENQRPSKKISFTYSLDTCVLCPLVHSERTSRAGFALDYYCLEVYPRRKVMSYVEGERDFKEVPDWCPHLVKDIKR